MLFKKKRNHCKPYFNGKKFLICEILKVFSARKRVAISEYISSKLDTPNAYPRYIKQSDGEASVMLEVWGMQSTF